MKLLVLTAIIAAVTSNPLTASDNWPWQVGKEYVYNVNSYTWSYYEESNGSTNDFQAKFIIRVKAPGQLLAKLENPLYAQIPAQLDSNPKYQPVQEINQPFEIFVEGGRVLSLKVPSSLSVSNENLLKGLVSALQVDLSAFGHVHSFPNSFDKETFQGLFKKSEADVTGDCETLYSVSPVSAEWRRDLPGFESEENPVEITKSKNYESCNKRVAYHVGLPEGVLWKGIAYENDEKQFIKHTTESRILVGKQGTIYKSETQSSVFVNTLLFGKQKTEVYSLVVLTLSSVQPESNTEWLKSAEVREVDSLLYTYTDSLFTKFDEKNVANAQKLLQEITPLLQDPSNLPKADFLSKFNILVRVIYSLNSEQLTQLTDSIEVAKSSKNVAKNNMWIIYRDAVAQAGSIAAFKEIKTWILTKKIQGEEAAEVITSVASAILYPTKEIATEFFDLATNTEVLEQKFLNNSALLAATKYLRFAKQDLFVVEKVIPRLSEELKQAIEKGDNTKAQVYVRVLGNLANPEILKVFAPYFDGRITVTKYLRIQMVISLKTLATLKNEQVKAVLFSILRNTAEPYEVRVAAALNIFMAIPSFEMIQIMAHMTKNDPSTQVRAVLTTSINFAAKLKDPRFAELAKAAQGVQSTISKEKYGYRYSTDSLIDEYTSSDDLSHFRELSYIGSEDSSLPLYHRGALRLRSNGWTEENWYTFSVSDMQQLLDYIVSAISESRKSDVEFKFSAKKIIEALNIKPESRSPLEGAYFIDSLNQQKLFTFNEEDLKAFISGTVQNVAKLVSGVETHFTKVVNDKRVFVTFPLTTGVPFMYVYNEPVAIIVQTKASFKNGAGNVGSLNSELQFTYARNMEGSAGFLDTTGDLFSSSGIVNKLQITIPAKLNTILKSQELILNFELPEHDVNLIHLSVTPYTSLQQTYSLLTISEEPATKIIKRSAKVVSTDINLGQLTGIAFVLQGYSYSSDYKNTGKVYDADILTNIRNVLYQKDVALTQFDLKYLAKETKNKDVTYNFYFNTLYNQKQSGKLGQATITNNVAPNSDARREEMVKRVAAGIDSAKVHLVDISAVFDGQQKVEYVFTAALANSFVDNKAQAAVFARGNEQINAVFKMVKPKIVPLNFEEALKNKIEVTYEADIKVGNGSNIHLHASGQRSKEYTEKLLNDPLAKQCLQEISKQNFYQKDCYKMIMKAHAPDFFKGVVEYKDVCPVAWKYIYSTYEYFKQKYSWDQKEDLLKTVDDGKIEFVSQAFYDDNYVNYEFTTKYGTRRLYNVPGLEYYPYAMAIYAPTTNWERAENCYAGYQYLPYCALDDNKVWTFSGRSYDYSLTGSWHVVMVDESNDLVVLSRRPSNKQEEVYVSYQTEKGQYVELEIKPSTVEVKSNTNKVSEGAVTTYWDDLEDAPLLEYYTLADGVLVFSINDGALRLVYDSQRLVIFTDKYRSTTRGICGQSSSQIRDDYMTPWGLVDRPDYYGASFSLDGDFSDSKTVELKKEAKLKAYQPVTKYTNILRSDAEWSKAENESVKGL